MASAYYIIQKPGLHIIAIATVSSSKHTIIITAVISTHIQGQGLYRILAVSSNSSCTNSNCNFDECMKNTLRLS